MNVHQVIAVLSKQHKSIINIKANMEGMQNEIDGIVRHLQKINVPKQSCYSYIQRITDLVEDIQEVDCQMDYQKSYDSSVNYNKELGLAQIQFEQAISNLEKVVDNGKKSL